MKRIMRSEAAANVALGLAAFAVWVTFIVIPICRWVR